MLLKQWRVQFGQQFLKRWLIVLLPMLSLPAKALVVLQYHHVDSDTPAITSVTPEQFKEHMAFLRENAFEVIAATKLRQLLASGEPMPDNTAVITFDDGYLSIYENAFPLLKKYNWPFTVFVNTKVHNENHKQFMSWAQLKDMSEHGATIANHTVSHPHLLRRHDGESKKDWEKRRQQEILQAEKHIRKHIGSSPGLFAYPFGEYDSALLQFLKEEKFLAFGQQSGAVAEHSNPQALPRFPFGGNYGGKDDFALKVTSLAFPSLHVAVVDEQGKPLKDPLLPAEVGRPVLHLQTEPELMGKVNCFASGQGSIPIEKDKQKLRIQAKKALPVGRSRYNCTAAAGSGRFYWHSQLFLRKKNDGSWYSEY